MASSAAAAKDRYRALDGLRGVAVLLVFCVHAAGNTAAIRFGIDFDQLPRSAISGPYEWFLYWLFASHHGVYLFFVLSGFLIGRMWWPRPVLGYREFAWRRTLRIYPAFLVAYAAALVLAWSDGTWQPPDVPRLLGNLVFLNGAPFLHVTAFSLVTWSLFYEMTFYLVFPAVALLAFDRGSRAGVFAWAAGVALPIAAALLGVNAIVLCWSLLFAGVALAVHESALRSMARRIPGAVVLGAYFTVTSLAFLDMLQPTLAILLFGCVALAVLAKSLMPGNLVSNLLSARPLRALGRISYSFYLVHWMPVVLIARVGYAHRETLSPAAAALLVFGGGFVTAAVLATLLWWIAERPYLLWVRDPRADTSV